MANATSGVRIKFKVSKRSKPPENREEGGGGGGGGEEESSKGIFSRFCDVCNKGFISGKALGGHTRIHRQPVKKVGDELCNNGGRSGNYVCCMCKKVFPSIKSLSGHMRSHPGRNWRGTQPPQGSNRHSSSSTVYGVDSPEFNSDERIDTAGTTRAPDVDLSKSIPTKRSREGVSSSAASDSIDASFDRMLEASSTLLSIAITVEMEANTCQDSGDPSRLSGRKKRKVTKEHPAGKSDSFKRDSSAEAQGVCRNDEDDSSRGKNNSDRGHSCELDDENPDSEMGIKKSNRNKGKRMRIVDLEIKEAVTGEAKKTTEKQPENRQVYRCSTCSREFSTHQALGGHRSGRNKRKNICNVESSSERRRSEKERKIIDFNLNDPPSLNEEEEEEEAENR